MKTANTLDGVDIQVYRRVGNSTRQVDKAIDLLFSGFRVEIRDHFKHGTDTRANELLFHRVVKRLQSEHNLDSLVSNKVINLDWRNQSMELLELQTL